MTRKVTEPPHVAALAAPVPGASKTHSWSLSRCSLLSHLGCLQAGCASKLLQAVPSRKKERNVSARQHPLSSLPDPTHRGFFPLDSNSCHPASSGAAEAAQPTQAGSILLHPSPEWREEPETPRAQLTSLRQQKLHRPAKDQPICLGGS